MKTVTVFILALLLSPYFIGLFQYHNACVVIANVTDQTDGDIENVLSTFNFEMDCMTAPNTFDYYKAGVRAFDLN